jgi:prepilin-type N-terminal cleavage/methylation domain-containing protein
LRVSDFDKLSRSEKLACDFTLIDLLVVIAIIGILVGWLFSAGLNRAVGVG